ncbi:MAG: DUF1844 domain-containing protein [Pirellulaceae bacterium]|nr:DUF1844 domain-containing protein [Pirellulaceae bacterium]
MSQPHPDDESRLHIDEDWKNQVQREKEQAKRQQQPNDPAAEQAAAEPEPSVGDSTGKSTASPRRGLEPPPPASFEFLISGMATQALAAMGQIPDDAGHDMPQNLDYARHYIDLLGVIETKTSGNLTAHEQKFLQQTLHQLRMLFVACKNP